MERFETEVRVRREKFVAEVRDCLKALARSWQESACNEEWLTGASTADLEEMAVRCRRLVERHQEKVEREWQAARERARQIQWFGSEFAAIQLEKRAEAAGAWALYEHVCAASDHGGRLETLKSAQKLLPKGFKSDRLH
jgi:hypothetical protein